MKIKRGLSLSSFGRCLEKITECRITSATGITKAIYLIDEFKTVTKPFSSVKYVRSKYLNIPSETQIIKIKIRDIFFILPSV